MEADQQLQNEPYDEEYIVDDGEDVASNLAVTPDQRNGDLGEDDMDDDDTRGDSPPDHHDDGLDDEEYDDDEHGDMDPMSPDGMGEAMGQRDHDFGDPEYGTGEPTGGDGDGDGDGGDMNDTGGEYDGMSRMGGMELRRTPTMMTRKG